MKLQGWKYVFTLSSAQMWRTKPWVDWVAKVPGLSKHTAYPTTVLFGYHIKVYCTEGTTQWYTAVIQSYDDSYKELTVLDDMVLEEHNVDPALVQMRIIGDGGLSGIWWLRVDLLQMDRKINKLVQLSMH